MSDPPTGCLRGEEILALKYAAQRQLARWANTPRLSPDQHARRDALNRAVGVLHDRAFAHGCQLRPSEGEEAP